MDNKGHTKEPIGESDKRRRFNYFASYLSLILGLLGLAYAGYIYYLGTNWLALTFIATISSVLTIFGVIFIVWLRIQK